MDAAIISSACGQATSPASAKAATEIAESTKDKPLGGAPQGAVHLPGTVFMHGARHCAFADCTIAHGGWYAMEIGAGCTGVVIDEEDLLQTSHLGLRHCGLAFGAKLATDHGNGKRGEIFLTRR